MARDLEISSSLVSMELQKLEDAGLIQRSSDTQDGRRLRLHLTPKGVAMLAEVNNVYRTRTARVLRRYSPAKRAAFFAILNDLGAS
jgi:DNA-binding MarR family transcriptional regulator